MSIYTLLPEHLQRLCGLAITSTAEVQKLWHVENAKKITSEEQVLALIDNIFPNKTSHNIFGRGDDNATLLCNNKHIVLSKDFFWEDLHFRRSYFTPVEVGAKALCRSTSDLAGTKPLGFSLGLMLPDDINMQALEQMLQGMLSVSNLYKMDLTGGDLCKGRHLGFSLTVWGEYTENKDRQTNKNIKKQNISPRVTENIHSKTLGRKCCQAGDIIFGVGQFGLARLGLLMLEKHGRQSINDYPAGVLAHLLPLARIEEGQKIQQLASLQAKILQENTLSAKPIEKNDASQTQNITAKTNARISLMDVSDGLAKDLPRLLGAFEGTINLENIHPEIQDMAEREKLCPVAFSILGGEDYALLGTCPTNLWAKLQKLLPEIINMGEVKENIATAPTKNAAYQNNLVSTNCAASECALQPYEQSINNTPQRFMFYGSDKLLRPFPANGYDHFGNSQKTHYINVYREQVEELVLTCGKACRTGIMAGFNGNASMRTGVVECIITRSGAAKGTLNSEDFALTKLLNFADVINSPDEHKNNTANHNKNSATKSSISSISSLTSSVKQNPDFGEGPTIQHLAGAKPSTETLMHLVLYAICPSAKVILHTHPPKMLALSLLIEPEKRLHLPLFESKAYAKLLGFVPGMEPGTPELAIAVAEKSKTHSCIWLENHGLVVWGQSCKDVLALSEELEQLAHIQLLTIK